jgi:hypothetical protein
MDGDWANVDEAKAIAATNAKPEGRNTNMAETPFLVAAISRPLKLIQGCEKRQQENHSKK